MIYPKKEIKNKQQISPYRHLTKSRPKPLLFALCEICSPCPANRDGTLFFQQNKPEQIDTDRVKRKPTEETARPISLPLRPRTCHPSHT